MRGKAVIAGMVGVAGLLAATGTPAQPAPQAAAPDRIGPVWDHREHPPTQAEVEARERARGLAPAARPDAEARDVDRLYRELTGGDPQSRAHAAEWRGGERR